MTLDFSDNDNETNNSDAQNNQNDEELFSGFDDTVIEEPEEAEPKKEKRAPSANRSFFIAVGILGGIFLIALIALVVFISIIAPQRTAAAARQQEVYAAQTSTAQVLTVVAVSGATNQAIQAEKTTTAVAAQALTISAATLAATEEPEILETATIEEILATETSVVVEETEIPEVPEEGTGEEGELSDEDRQATLNALLTQLAAGGTPTEEATEEGGGEGLTTPVVQSDAMTSTALAEEAMPDTGIADDLKAPLIIGGGLLLVAIFVVARRLRFSNR